MINQNNLLAGAAGHDFGCADSEFFQNKVGFRVQVALYNGYSINAYLAFQISKSNSGTHRITIRIFVPININCHIKPPKFLIKLYYFTAKL